MAGSRRLNGLSDDLLARVDDHLPDGPLLIALSGGADSAVCAWAAARRGAGVRAIHVDHGWPGSPTLRRAAEVIARQLGIDCRVKEVVSPPGPSPEGQARRVRYEALESELNSNEYLLTGHTMDDQAETILGNILRGAGAGGLVGIPRRRGRIVRPLLDVSRAETRELAGLLGLAWCEDPTNLDTSLRRNSLRREVIPYLETRFNPAFRTALARLASNLEEDDELLEAAARSIPLEITDSGLRMPAPLLCTMSPPVAARAVRRALRMVHDGYPGSSAEVGVVLSVAGGGPPSELPGAVRVDRVGPWVVLDRAASPGALPAVSWPMPGTVPFGPWTFESWIEELPPQVFSLSPFVEVFDADTMPESLLVRTWESGDAIAIAGGSKRLPDVLAEAQVPAARRGRWPVVASEDAVVWVPGVRRADAGWVGTATKRYLWVRAALEGTS